MLNYCRCGRRMEAIAVDWISPHSSGFMVPSVLLGNLPNGRHRAAPLKRPCGFSLLPFAPTRVSSSAAGCAMGRILYRTWQEAAIAVIAAIHSYLRQTGR